MLWQNTTTGDRSIWLMDGVTWDGSYVSLPQVATEWSIAGSGDFNADGSPDIVWQNTTTGDRSIWFMNGTSWGGSHAMLPTMPVQWSIAAVGDFDADGKPDLVWENAATGDRLIWFMNGSTWEGSQASLPNVPTAWKIAAVGDFNADGKPDLAWQNTTTGERSIWYMNGATYGGSFTLLPTVPTEWDIAAAADFDGDADPDLVWQNTSTGERSIWLMNGTSVDSYVLLQTVPTEWSIAGMLQADEAAASGDLVINVTDVNAGAISERDLCLTIAVGHSAASECGDLRIAHELPSARTLNQERAPVLVYNSAYGEPFPTVAANATLPAGTTGLDSVVAILRINGVARAQSVYEGSAWPAVQAVRIALGFDATMEASGIFRYTLEVTAYYTTTSSARSVSGDLVVVNRKQSPFGAGWWLAGLDQLLFDPAGNPSVWIGGDGSVRRYTASGPDWIAPSIDRPDTIKRDGSGFVRLLSGGVKVRFDSFGRHIATKNRLGYETKFGYDSSARLSSIVLPSVKSSMIIRKCISLCVPWKADSPRYAFHYSANGKLRTIDASGADPAPRVLTVFTSGVHLDSIVGPDTTRVAFGYLTPSSGRMVSRSNRARTATHFRYDRANKLESAKLEMTGGDSIVTRLVAAESRGMADGAGGGAIQATLARTQLDGPRLDAGDTASFWVNRFGSPDRISDALGVATTIERADPSFPGLVTAVRHPNGRIVSAGYDGRGSLVRSTDSSVFRDEPGGRTYATTTYAWDHRWDDVTQIVSPEGVVINMAYDSVGNRMWQERGSPSFRVNFGYNSNGLLESITEPGVTGADSVLYDAFGNPALMTNALGVRTEISNDAIGRPWDVLAPFDSGDTLFVQTITQYDVFDRPLMVATRAPFDTVTYADTTENGDPVTIPHPEPVGQMGLTVTNTYGPEGTLLSVTRYAPPDPAGVGVIVTRFAYDAALRKVKEIAPHTSPDSVVSDSTVYDAAGNAIEFHSRRTSPGSTGRLVVRMQYDALNRLTQRILPRVRYPARMQGVPTSQVAGLYPGVATPYPQYPNDGSSGYVIEEEVATFAYDSLGRMTSADNPHAKVRRSYYPDGKLRADTLRIRPLAPDTSAAAFETHVYGLQYSYDLDGRRTELRHPGTIAPVVAGVVRDLTRYEYHPLTGDLGSVTDPLGNQFTIGYNLRGMVESVTRPGGIFETSLYDDLGRLRSNTVTSTSSSQYAFYQSSIRAATLTYDVRDKLRRVQSTGGFRDDLTTTYSPLGHFASGITVSHGRTVTGYDTESVLTEEVTHDAMGNQVESETTEDYTGPHHSNSTRTQSYVYEPGTGRLVSNPKIRQRDSIYYDGAGNEIFRTDRPQTSDPLAYYRDRASYYAADGTLRAADARYVSTGSIEATAFFTGVFEEYRYDALGRRIWVRARRLCEGDPMDFDAECRLSKVRRIVWDGDEELYEIQMPGQDGSPHLETDTNLPALPADNAGGSNLVDPNPFYGRVAYTHALGIDQPLGIVRMNYGDRLNDNGHDVGHRALDPFMISPIWNERGEPYLGTFEDGGVGKCQPPSGVGHDTVLRCVYIGYQAGWVAYMRPSFRPHHWHGSLTEDKRDAAGTNFRRNRYYDSEKGKFTQEDPIGLAGGINLYGFAGGDPVNYGDPFGLNPLGKIIKLTVQGFKTIMKNVSEDAMIEAVKSGDDVMAPSQQAANRIARAASGGKRPIGPETNRLPGGQRGRPHYHVAGRKGPSHIFFSAIAALSLSHHAKDASPMVQAAAAVGDFFNPLSLPNDLVQAAQEVRSIVLPTPPGPQQP